VYTKLNVLMNIS